MCNVCEVIGHSNLPKRLISPCTSYIPIMLARFLFDCPNQNSVDVGAYRQSYILWLRNCTLRFHTRLFPVLEARSFQQRPCTAISAEWHQKWLSRHTMHFLLWCLIPIEVAVFQTSPQIKVAVKSTIRWLFGTHNRNEVVLFLGYVKTCKLAKYAHTSFADHHFTIMLAHASA